MTTLADRKLAAPDTDEAVSNGIRRATCRHCWQAVSYIDGAWAHAYGQYRCWRKDLDRKILQDALNTIARLMVEHDLPDADAIRCIDEGQRHIAETLT